MSRHKHWLWGRWANMINATTNPNDGAWKYNGGRGVKVCRRWQNFWHFVDDVESHLGKPQGDRRFLARKDPAGDWKLSNVQWDTKQAYANRRTDCVFYTHKGVRRSLHDWCEHLGLRYAGVYTRISKYGWTIPEALNLKARK